MKRKNIDNCHLLENDYLLQCKSVIHFLKKRKTPSNWFSIVLRRKYTLQKKARKNEKKYFHRFLAYYSKYIQKNVFNVVNQFKDNNENDSIRNLDFCKSAVGVTMDNMSHYFCHKYYTNSQFKRRKIDVVHNDTKLSQKIGNSSNNQSKSSHLFPPYCKMKVERSFVGYQSSLIDMLISDMKRNKSKMSIESCRKKVTVLLEEINNKEKFLIGKIMGKLRSLRCLYVDKLTGTLLDLNDKEKLNMITSAETVVCNDFYLGPSCQRYHTESCENYFAKKNEYNYISKLEFCERFKKKDNMELNVESITLGKRSFQSLTDLNIDNEDATVMEKKKLKLDFSIDKVLNDVMRNVNVDLLIENVARGSVNSKSEELNNNNQNFHVEKLPFDNQFGKQCNDEKVQISFEQSVKEMCQPVISECFIDYKDALEEINKDAFVRVRNCTELCFGENITNSWGYDLYKALLQLTKFTNENDLFLDSWHEIMMFEKCRHCFQYRDSYESNLENEYFCKKSFACSDNFKRLIQLQQHSSNIRTLIRKIYKIRELCIMFNNIKHTKETCSYGELSKFVDNSLKPDPKTEVLSCYETRISEQEVKKKFKQFFVKFERDIYEYPNKFCDICNMWFYCKKADGNIESMLSLFKGNIPNNLLHFCEYYEAKLKRSVLFVCCNCQTSLQQHLIPPAAEINNMSFFEMPNQIKKLNLMELILCKLAKPFHTVIRLSPMNFIGSVGSFVRAIKGTTVHFPLPVVKTQLYLKKTLPNVNGLDILIDNVPIKGSVAWRNLVKLKKNVYPAIHWLKENNRLYSDIDIIPIISDIEKNNLHITMDTCNDQSLENESLLKKWKHCEMKNISVRPVDHIKPDNEDYELYRMQKITNTKPLYYSDKDLDHKCFPELYPFGNGGMLDDRKIKLSPSKYLRALFYNRDNRFRKNPNFLFFALSRYQDRQLNQGMYSMIHTKRGYDIQRTDLINCDQKKLDNIEANLTTFVSKVRGSKEYFKGLNSDLTALDREYGPATFFVTLSVAEYAWIDMDKFVRCMNSGSYIPKHYTFGNTDAATVSNQFRRRWNAFMKHVLKNPKGPLGKIIHYFCRIEYQARGAPHVHMKVWIEGAPILIELIRLSNETVHEFRQRINMESNKIKQFIDKYITCCLPNEKDSPELFSLVNKYQRHKCTISCLRYGKKKSSNVGLKRCRYGFPRTVSNATCVQCENSLLSTRIKNGKNCKIYALKRYENEVNINDYNPAILLAWKANMDIQYIGEETQLLNGYITSYVTKSEKNNLTEIWTGVAKSESLRKNLAIFGRQMLHNREIGEYEAFDLVLGNPYLYKSASVVFVPTTCKENRKRRLKTYAQILAIDDENEKVYFNNMWDDYYPNRPKEMDNFSLHTVCSEYIFQTKKPSDSSISFKIKEFGWLRQCKKRIVKTSYYDITTCVGEEGYFRSLLMLFKPWRNECELLNKYSSYKEAVESCCEMYPDMVEYDKRMKHLFKSRHNNKYEKENIQNENDEGKSMLFDSNNINRTVCEIIKEDRTFSDQFYNDKEFDFNLKQIVDGSDVQRKETLLNDNQRCVYTKIVKNIIPNIENNFSCTPVKMIISGVAGTGKSFLIDVIADKVRFEFKDTDAVAVLGPTGVAAFNVHGSTIHSFFKLSVQKGKESQSFSLCEDAIQKLRIVWKKLKLIIVDEFSMVSNVMLAKMHIRLLQVLRDNGIYLPFSGISVLLFGDLLQLPPVNADFIFQTISSKAAMYGLGVPGPVDNFYNEFEYYELEINMRQNEDLKYAQVLNRIRTGLTDIVDFNLLKMRIIGNENNNVLVPVDFNVAIDYFVKLLQTDSKILALLPKNEQVDLFNNVVVKKKDLDIVNIMASDNLPLNKKMSKKMFEKIRKMKTSDSGGLNFNLTLGIGTRVMLRRNLDVKNGLVNGTLGYVTNLLHDKDNNNCVKEIYVRFDHQSTDTSIAPVNVEFKVCANIYVHRKQFPLTVAYAITIHKCQGLTLNNVLIDIGTNCFSDSMAYVALSRVKTLSNIHLIDISSSQLKCTTLAMREYNRLRKSVGLKIIENFNAFLNVNYDNNIEKKPLKKVNEYREKKSRIEEFISEKFLKLPNVESNCYCNALMQCILQMDEPIESLKYFENDLSKCITNMFDYYKQIKNETKCFKPNVFSTKLIMKQVWNEKGQQDVHHFWLKLIDILPQKFLSYFEFSICEKKQCPSPKCNGRLTEKIITNQNCFVLTLPKHMDKSVKFADCFEQTLFVAQICSHCKEEHLIQVEESIVWEKEQKYLIMLLPLADQRTKKKINLKISHFVANKTKVFGKTLELICGIQHINSDNIQFGHYVAWIRKQKNWYKLSDDEDCKIVHNFVRNLQDMYMLFFKIVE